MGWATRACTKTASAERREQSTQLDVRANVQHLWEAQRVRGMNPKPSDGRPERRGMYSSSVAYTAARTFCDEEFVSILTKIRCELL